MWKGRSGEGGGRSWKGLSGCCGPWGPRGDAGPTVGISATFYCEQKAQRWSLGSHTLRTGGCNRAAARLWSQPGSVHRREPGPARPLSSGLFRLWGWVSGWRLFQTSVFLLFSR